MANFGPFRRFTRIRRCNRANDWGLDTARGLCLHFFCRESQCDKSSSYRPTFSWIGAASAVECLTSAWVEERIDWKLVSWKYIRRVQATFRTGVLRYVILQRRGGFNIVFQAVWKSRYDWDESLSRYCRVSVRVQLINSRTYFALIEGQQSQMALGSHCHCMYTWNALFE